MVGKKDNKMVDWRVEKKDDEQVDFMVEKLAGFWEIWWVEM